MAEQVSAGWLTGYDGNKFAPKTFFQEVLNANGARIFANLNTNDDLGSKTQPVYIDNGQFRACDDFNYNLEVIESNGVVYIQLNQGDQISLISNDSSISITHVSGTEISITAPVFNGTINGLVPAPSDSDTVLFLRADGTWDSPSDTKVQQLAGGAGVDYPILTRYSNATSGSSGYVRYNTKCTINHSTGTMTVDELKADTSVTTQSVILNNLRGYGSNISVDTSLIPSGYYNLGTDTDYWNNIASSSLMLYYQKSDNTVINHTSLGSSYAYFYGRLTGNTIAYIYHGETYGVIKINGYDDYKDNGIDLSSRTGVVTAVSFNATSDARLKENFISFKPEKSILDLPVYKFDFINGAKGQIGCKAQDLQLICPELVVENDEGYLTIKESKIVYLLLDKMKEMQKEIDELKGG